jgi:uncharacterized protein
MSGAKVAQLILNAYSLRKVRAEQVMSFLSDHYDPGHKVLRLSADVYQGRLTVAWQHRQGYLLKPFRPCFTTFFC